MSESKFVDIGPLRVFDDALQFGQDPEGFRLRVDGSGASSSTGDRLTWDEIGEYSLDLTPYGRAPRLKAGLRAASYLLSPVGATAASSAPGGEDYLGISPKRGYGRGVGGVLPHEGKTKRAEREVIQEMLALVMDAATRSTVLGSAIEVVTERCLQRGLAAPGPRPSP
jgi:hypothetical protein